MQSSIKLKKKNFQTSFSFLFKELTLKKQNFTTQFNKKNLESRKKAIINQP